MIINADDFGLSTGTNLGIREAHEKGILTSASLLATTPSLGHALKILKKCPNLGVGIHLSLTLGKPVLGPKKTFKLVNTNGHFYPSFTRLLIKAQTDKEFLNQVKGELDAQINKLISIGVNLDHINSERHTHMIPNIYPLVLDLAKKYRIKYLRIPQEDFFLASGIFEKVTPFISTNILKFLIIRSFSISKRKIKKIKFYGLIYTSRVNRIVLKSTLSKIKPGISEILLHPAKFLITKKEKSHMEYRKQKILEFMKDKTRVDELHALTDKSIKKFITENNIELTNFRELKNTKYL